MLAPGTARNGPSSDPSAGSGPRNWPVTCALVCPPAPFRWKIEVSRLSACGAHSIHAASASPAALHGNEAKNEDALAGSDSSAKVRAVTTPKFPPPPPRSAHSRSGSLRASTVRSRPSAVAIWVSIR